MDTLRIELVSTNPRSLEEVSKQLRDIAEKMGIRIKGPIPLPTKRLRITTLKNPSGEGTSTYHKFEMRIHKRIIDVPNPDNRFVRRMMEISLPEDVKISIVMLSK